jgi:tRNA U55 pseudouridine synthase TruB
MNALSRRRVGPYTLQNSVSPQEITAESISRLVHPAQTCLSGMPAMRATPEAIDLVQRGLRIDCPDSLDASDGHEVIVESPSGRLTAIAEIVGTELQPRYVFRSD